MGDISELREQAENTVSRGATHMGWIPSKLCSIVSPKSVLVFVFLTVSACSLVIHSVNNNSSLFTVGKDDFECSTLPSHSVAEDPGRGLVQAIQSARRVATGSVNGSLQLLSPEALDAWNGQHPCQCRAPGGLLSYYTNRKTGAENLPRNPLWEEVFEEYSNLHRQCLEKVGDIGDYFLQKNTSTGCKFLVADVADETEFGDKILVLASSLLYAILTQRVILIPESSLVPSYMCEPFAGSSWLLNSSRFPLRPTSPFTDELWNLDREISTSTDWHLRRCASSPPSAFSPYAVGMGTNQRQPQQRFYCSFEQTAYSEATVMYLSGAVYTIPKLFATPVFRPVLEALFPDRIALTRLLRSAFLPGNSVWNRVRGLGNGYLWPAHRLVGIDVRYEYMNDILNKRITDCLIHKEILPDVTDSWGAHAPLKLSGTSVFRVLVSSLQLDLRDHLSWTYERNPTLTGEAVGVIQVSQSGNERFSVEADVEAFKEALLLSFSDQLLVTPKSTVGSVAQAYGALIPWFIELRTDGLLRKYGNCERAKTIELCNYFAEKRYRCSSDSLVDGKLISGVVPYIDNCPTVDHDDGIQLITSSWDG